MSRTRTKAGRLLIISAGAGTFDESVEAKLRREYADHLVVNFDPKLDFEKLIKPRARVVVAGGDGTIEFVVRKLVDSDHPLGILPLGTYNNLAHALQLPDRLDDAIEVTRKGRARAITVGRVNGHVFLEACACGLFGDAIVLGETAKELAFGDVVEKLRHVIEARPFRYELSGDLTAQGSAMSLVFTNTASIGNRLRVGDASPVDPYLELSLDAGRTRTDILARAVASTLRPDRTEPAADAMFRFRKLEVRTRPRVRAYADNRSAGRTPATITAEVSALKVLMPAAAHK